MLRLPASLHQPHTFVAELRKKRGHYLAFLKNPDALRRSLSTTNAVEAVNGQLEIIRRNSGRYFNPTTPSNLNWESSSRVRE